MEKTCTHLDVVNNNEGFEVCSFCGLVQSEIFIENVPPLKSNTKVPDSFIFLKDIFENAHIPECFLDQVVKNCKHNNFKSLKFAISERNWILYNLYNILIENDWGLTYEHFESISGLTKHQMWEISKKMNISNPIPLSKNFLGLFSNELNLNRLQVEKIKLIINKIAFKFYFLKYNFLIAVSVILFFKNFNKKFIIKVCNICNLKYVYFKSHLNKVSSYYLRC